MKKSRVLSVCFVFICAFALVVCSSKDTEQDMILDQEMKLIYEETISPNKKYAESEEDAVNYNIEVYQGKDYKILVNAKSNSEFFESLQYELEYDQEIIESDIAIEWTTLCLLYTSNLAGDPAGNRRAGRMDAGKVCGDYAVCRGVLP